MKRLKPLILTLCALVLLSGCVKMDMTITASASGTVTTSVTALVSETLIELTGTTDDTMIETLTSQFTGDNVSVQEISKTIDGTKYIGISATNALTSSIDAEVKDGILTLTIPLTSFYDAADTAGFSEGTVEAAGYDLASLEEAGTEVTITVKMPDEAEANLGTAEDNVVTVDLLEEMMKDESERTDNLVITSKATENQAPMYILGGGFILALVFAWKLMKKKS